MATATATKLITAEEFMAMDLGEGIHELVQGEVVEMPQPRPEHGRISFGSGFVLEVYGRASGFGYVTGNDSAVVTERDPDTVRGADVAFYSQGRWPRENLGPGLIPVPPDLVIEVYSPSNRSGEMRRKIDEYLRAGVLMVWVLHPVRKQLLIYRADELAPRVYELTDVVDGLDELPGFRCVVSEFFA